MNQTELKAYAEAMALEKYPNRYKKDIQYDFNEDARDGYAQAIIDNYKEPERVNEKLLETLKECLSELFLIHSQYGDKQHCRDHSCAITLAEEAIQSASQQQEKENYFATTIIVGKRTIDLGNKGILTIDVKSDAVEFTEWLFENEWKKRTHTQPNKVGQYWYNRHCKYIPIQELYELFKQSKTK